MLTGVQQLAARLLAEGRTSTEIAQECGKSRRTIEAWKALPEFKDFCAEMCKRAEAEEIAEVATTLSRLRGKMFARVEGILDDEEVAPRTQLQACTLVAKMCGLNGDENRAATDLMQLLLALKGEISGDSYAEITSAIARLNDRK